MQSEQCRTISTRFEISLFLELWKRFPPCHIFFCAGAVVNVLFTTQTRKCSFSCLAGTTGHSGGQCVSGGIMNRVHSRRAAAERSLRQADTTGHSDGQCVSGGIMKRVHSRRAATERSLRQDWIWIMSSTCAVNSKYFISRNSASWSKW